MNVTRVVRRQNGLLRPTSCLSRKSPQLRSKHTVPSLGKHEELFTEKGVPGLFTPSGYEEAWTRNMTFLVNRLNHILAGDERENWSPKDVLINTARNPATANTFNYASMAHNNHFFFRTLSPDLVAMPNDLQSHLTRSFSSLDSLRTTFLATARAMFGPGFVWLCQVHNASPSHPNTPDPAYTAGSTPLDFRIVSTYLAGSPYPQAHYRQQPTDMNTQNMLSAQDYARQTQYQNSPGAFGSHARRAGMGEIEGGGEADKRRFGGADLVPVMCVSTFEHAYLLDWGVDAKHKYLEAWWDKIDWEQVWSHCVIKEPSRKLMR